jgi:hypothetical protein
MDKSPRVNSRAPIMSAFTRHCQMRGISGTVTPSVKVITVCVLSLQGEWRKALRKEGILDQII